jgi:serine/threonine-protein kinase RsbW
MVERASSNPRMERGEQSSHLVKPAFSGQSSEASAGMVPPSAVVEKSVKLTVFSDQAAVRAVQDQILEEIAHFGFDHQSRFAIKLALEEALINAMKHGNKWDPKKKVHIEYKVSSTRLEVIVEDEGPGFMRDDVPDPTLDENIEKCSGRGILLIEAYMNNVHWSRGGRRLHMIKNNEPDSSS